MGVALFPLGAFRKPWGDTLNALNPEKFRNCTKDFPPAKRL
jgi:hypothetical protein